MKKLITATAMLMLFASIASAQNASRQKVDDMAQANSFMTEKLAICKRYGQLADNPNLSNAVAKELHNKTMECLRDLREDARDFRTQYIR